MFLPGESQGQGSLVGCGLWGRTELDTTEVTQQQPYFVNSSGGRETNNSEHQTKIPPTLPPPVEASLWPWGLPNCLTLQELKRQE